MKILHTSDWHIGPFKGPEVNGVNQRAEDTKRCINTVIETALQKKPDLTLISGDIFHVGKTWGDRQSDEVITAYRAIKQLAEVSGMVVVMKGTPNHDGEGQFKLLKELFSEVPNVNIMDMPGVVHSKWADIAVVPGFDAGVFRAKFPGLSKQEENAVFSQELSNIVLGLRTNCSPERPAILMAHYTVPGANIESGQTQFLTQFEPVIMQESLLAANYDLVALGHIHRPQSISGLYDTYYAGALNALNFNDEGQERGFWIHEILEKDEDYIEEISDPYVVTLERDNCNYSIQSYFHKTPNREFITIQLDNTDVENITCGNLMGVAAEKWLFNDSVQDKIVRVLYTCSLENHKAFNHAQLEHALYDGGAFWVADISPERTIESSNRDNFAEETDPEENLIKYFNEKRVPEPVTERLILKARPIIAKAMAGDTAAAFSGEFIPRKIEVENYRAYENESFDFDNIDFCTINGSNGAGKSSLFMDAIIDCLFEEPREGKGKKGDAFWVRNAEGVKKGGISFIFSIGDKTYRVVRTRVRSRAGNLTLNLAEQVDGEWQDRSKPRSDDTQDEILNILGMDSMTLKSCALIMQDQYGLFLQAGSEERMSVLSGLLGLGIYVNMETMARDELICHRQISDKKTEKVKLLYADVENAGKPAEELEVKIKENEELGEKLQSKMLLKEQTSMLLTGKKAAADRLDMLNREIRESELRENEVSQKISVEDKTISACDVILGEEFAITQKVTELRCLEEREKQLLGVSAAYRAKEMELGSYRTELKSEDIGSENLNREMSLLQEELTTCLKNVKELPETEKKVELYKAKKKELEDMQELFQNYNKLQSRVTEAQYAMETSKQVYRQEEIRLDAERMTLEDKIKLLADSQCIDIDNAACKFLSDAKKAEIRLAQVIQEASQLAEENEKKLKEHQLVIDKLLSELNAIGFDSEVLDSLRRECFELQAYEAELEEGRKVEEKCNTLKTKISMLQKSIDEANSRRETMGQKITLLENELMEFEEGFEDYEDVIKQIEVLKPWLDKEKELPVSRERQGNAIRMKAEYALQLEKLDAELAMKREQAGKERENVEGIAELEHHISIISEEIKDITERSHEIQQTIGALKVKIKDIARMKEEADQLNNEIAEEFTETSDYDMLRIAFSKEGIPHQIIRSIIPRFEDIANAILGDMTGGHLGVEFRTEKIKRNKDEKPTLDIYIEEYGKSSLPYLSKSGGEKVKASLAVILALAEIKATTAGIQFGMLFIDEPPFLDSEGIQAYCDALEAIRRRYPNIKIMAITHDPTMKIRFPQSVTVIKTETGSRVVMD